jgi:hypothetical protein
MNQFDELQECASSQRNRLRILFKWISWTAHRISERDASESAKGISAYVMTAPKVIAGGCACTNSPTWSPPTCITIAQRTFEEPPWRVELLQGKWKLQLLCEMRTGPVRLGQLKRVIPSVSKKALRAGLRHLEMAAAAFDGI